MTQNRTRPAPTAARTRDADALQVPDAETLQAPDADALQAPDAETLQAPDAETLQASDADALQAPDADAIQTLDVRTSAPRPPLVAVAVSGGADSLYSLIRLQEEGVPVIAIHGLFAQELELGQDPAAREAARAARQRLARSCETLGIPLHVPDLSGPFMDSVIRPFVEGYAAGLTPNPCALCNRQIKFGLLLEKARELGATRMATGHYVRSVFMEDAADPSARTGCMPGESESSAHPGYAPDAPESSVPCSGYMPDAADPSAHAGGTPDEPGTSARAGYAPDAGNSPQEPFFDVFQQSLPSESSGFPALLQGADPNKDQSYFLSLVPKEQLAFAFFPLGGARKADVMQALKRRGIEVPQPGESRGACFLPDDDYRRFVPMVAEQLGLPLSGPGPMLLRDGTRLGTHKGLWNYTEGQRHGLGIGWKEPLRVLAKEKEGNVLRLGPREELWTDSCLCAGLNILLPPRFWPETLLVKTRYREQPRPAQVEFLRAGGPGSEYERPRPSEAAAPQPLEGLFQTAPPPGEGEQPNPSEVAAGDLSEAVLRIRFLTRETAVAPGQVAALYMPLPGCFEEDGRPVLRLIAGGVIL